MLKIIGAFLVIYNYNGGPIELVHAEFRNVEFSSMDECRKEAKKLNDVLNHPLKYDCKPKLAFERKE